MYAMLNPYTDLQPRHCRDMNREELEAFIQRGPGERAQPLAGAISRLRAFVTHERRDRRRIDVVPRIRSTP